MVTSATGIPARCRRLAQAAVHAEPFAAIELSVAALFGDED